MLRPYGAVVSTRILYDEPQQQPRTSRGVGFARMESHEVCERIIADFNGTTLPGAQMPLQCRFADAVVGRQALSGSAASLPQMPPLAVPYYALPLDGVSPRCAAT